MKAGPSAREHALQASIVDYHDSFVPVHTAALIAIPNGGQRGVTSADLGPDASADQRRRARLKRARVGKKLKDEGVRAGAPDLMLVLPGGRIHWLELKAPAVALLGLKAGTLQDSQEDMHRDLRALGHPVTVIFSLEDYVNVLRREGVPVRASVGSLPMR